MLHVHPGDQAPTPAFLSRPRSRAASPEGLGVCLKKAGTVAGREIAFQSFVFTPNVMLTRGNL